MKMHKFEVHVLDFEEYGPDEYERMIENLDFIGKVFYIKSANIGKWKDDHKLNQSSATIDTYNECYKK